MLEAMADGGIPDQSTRTLMQERRTTATSVARPERAQRPLALVVDDFEDSRVLYAMCLADSGFRVVEARDGEEALACVARERPDVIIMDLAMPRMDGITATRAIKSNEETASIPVIVLTGNATAPEIARAHAAGADDVLTKPCVPARLTAVTMKHLG